MPSFLNERSIRLKTWLDEDVLLLEHATLNEELGRPFEFQLDLLSVKKDIKVADAAWESMTISVDLPEGGTRYFNGIVTRFTVGEFTGEQTRYRATLRPWLWTLTRVSDCRIFQNMTVPDIIKQVCRNLGFSDFKDKLTESYRTWEYLVQYRETSFNFISRLMEQEGLYYYFEHAEDGHTMVLADSHGGHAPIPDYKTITYLPPEAMQTGVRGEVEHISRWQLSRQVQPIAYTIDDFNFETPRATLLGTLQDSADGDDGGAAFEMYDYPGGFKNSDEGEQAVKIAMQERRAQVERVHGAGNARGLARISGPKFVPGIGAPWTPGPSLRLGYIPPGTGGRRTSAATPIPSGNPERSWGLNVAPPPKQPGRLPLQCSRSPPLPRPSGKARTI